MEVEVEMSDLLTHINTLTRVSAVDCGNDDDHYYVGQKNYNFPDLLPVKGILIMNYSISGSPPDYYAQIWTMDGNNLLSKQAESAAVASIVGSALVRFIFDGSFTPAATNTNYAIVITKKAAAANYISLWVTASGGMTGVGAYWGEDLVQNAELASSRELWMGVEQQPDYPAVANVHTGDTVNLATGTLTLTAAANVLEGTGVFGLGGTSITPSYSPDFPALGSVLETDTSNGSAGTYHEATVAEVQDGVMFGPASAYEGTYVGGGACDYPSEDNVRNGVEYDVYTGNMTLPAVGDVRDGETYGTDGTEYEGTLELPAAADVKDGVGYGEDGTEYEGEYDPMAAAVFPAATNVSDVETAYGPTGAEYAGEIDLDDYVLLVNITLPEAGEVVTTAGDFGIAGSLITPTLDMSDYTLTTDITLPEAGEVVTTAGDFGIAGSLITPTLNMSLYTLISSVVDKVHVETGYYNYPALEGGEEGTIDVEALEAAAYADGESVGEAAGKILQLADDIEEVETNKKYILKPNVILTVEGTYSGEGDIPATPTMTIVAGTLSVVATIDGAVGATNYLAYKKESATAWTTSNRSGDGTITVSSLEADVNYIFVAYSAKDGVYSLPSTAVIVKFDAAIVAPSATVESEDDFQDLLDAFGETVTYYPAGGGTREILAIVDREEYDVVGGRAVTAPVIQVSILNDIDDGITSGEVNTGGDKISIAYRPGDTAQQRVVRRVVSMDGRVLVLELR